MSGGGRQRVFLGMPGYGQLTAGAARGFYRSSAAHDVFRAVQTESALLGDNFNQLWVTALNMHRAGGLDYFAMQHTDVEPEDGWLDKLVGELEAKGLDVLGVAVAIKDGRGLTSTALDNDTGDPWRAHCRLTMTEVHRLPETFTSADVGRPLLLNTGLWVCRFNPEWAAEVWFEVRSRIAVDPTGEYVAVNEPEDWGFSRQLHRLGLKVGCTRTVAALHRGPAAWGNTRAWGQYEFDRDLLTESAIPGGAQ